MKRPLWWFVSLPLPLLSQRNLSSGTKPIFLPYWMDWQMTKRTSWHTCSISMVQEDKPPPVALLEWRSSKRRCIVWTLAPTILRGSGSTQSILSLDYHLYWPFDLLLPQSLDIVFNSLISNPPAFLTLRSYWVRIVWSSISVQHPYNSPFFIIFPVISILCPSMCLLDQCRLD